MKNCSDAAVAALMLLQRGCSVSLRNILGVQGETRCCGCGALSATRAFFRKVDPVRDQKKCGIQL
jgi:hypothetical protein